MTPRHRYRIVLGALDVDPAPTVRALTEHDRRELAPLMLAAYAGTIDDEGETLDDAIDEIDRWVEHGGDVQRSFGYDVGGRLRSAALVTITPQHPVLAFVFTHPEDKGKGLGRQVVEAVLNQLRRDGHAEIELWITEGNVASERLFARLGARPLRP